MRVRMRRRHALIGAAAVAVTLGALIPVWTRAPSAPRDPDEYRVPADLFYRLIEECQGVVPLGPDQTVLPNWVDTDADIDARAWLELYQVDQGTGALGPVEPTAEQAALLGAANLCLGSYQLEDWKEPPQFDAFHRNMYYDYIAGALVPCLAARGIDARVPSRTAFETLEPVTWYQAQLIGLDFAHALSTWRDCPPYPTYLEDAGHHPDPVEVLWP
jgi:hypothetical protein